MVKAEASSAEEELVPLSMLAGTPAESSGAALRRTGGGARPHTDTLGSAQLSSSISVAGNLKTRQKEVGFQVLVGVAHKLLASLEAGATGAILAFAAPSPTACYEIYAAWKEGDPDLARLKQDRINVASNRVAGELGVPALKYASDLNGYYGGPPRLPMLPLTGEQKAEVERLMSDIRN